MFTALMITAGVAVVVGYVAVMTWAYSQDFFLGLGISQMVADAACGLLGAIVEAIKNQ